MDKKKYTLEYICSHLGEENSANMYHGAVVPPIFETSLHVFDTVEELIGYKPSAESGKYIYGRVDNPTVKLLEKKIAAIEEADDAVCFGSGMAAITSAIMYFIRPGDHIITVKNAYGPTRIFIDNNLKDLGVECTYVDGTDVAQFEEAIRPNTKLIYLESPTSVVLELQDISALAELAKKHGIYTIIDNTYAAGVYQKPLNVGIDVTVHTLSKYYGGHSDVIGGVACGNGDIIIGIKDKSRELYGGIIGPFEAWLTIRSLRSLPVRLKRSSENGLKVSEMLEKHPKVEYVRYPGLPSYPQAELYNRQMTGSCGLLSVVLKASVEESVKFVNALKLFKKGVSWGGFESLACMPMYKFSEEMMQSHNATRGMIRLYCGLDDTAELIADIEQALDSITV